MLGRQYLESIWLREAMRGCSVSCIAPGFWRAQPTGVGAEMRVLGDARDSRRAREAARAT